jgi:hypothetical protein
VLRPNWTALPTPCGGALQIRLADLRCWQCLLALRLRVLPREAGDRDALYLLALRLRVLPREAGDRDALYLAFAFHIFSSYYSELCALVCDMRIPQYKIT